MTTVVRNDIVRAFDPRTLGVVKQGRIIGVGRKYARVDFGLTGTCKVAYRDILEVTEPAGWLRVSSEYGR